MNYNNPKLRDMLASEYALGTLHGPARRRFERLMKYDADLRRTVSEWQDRIAPLAQAVPPITPPRRVWRKIQSEIRRTQQRPGFWQSLNFWRTLGVLSSSVAVALLLYLGMTPKPDVVPAYVAVLADSKSQPVMVVNFNPGTRELSVNVVNPQLIAADRSYELWSLPKGGAPRSLGLVPEVGKAVVRLAHDPAQSLPEVPALAVSLEPKGGSPTGAPTGPVLFTGPLLRL